MYQLCCILILAILYLAQAIAEYQLLSAKFCSPSGRVPKRILNEFCGYLPPTWCVDVRWMLKYINWSTYGVRIIEIEHDLDHFIISQDDGVISYSERGYGDEVEIPLKSLSSSKLKVGSFMVWKFWCAISGQFVSYPVRGVVYLEKTSTKP